MHQRRESKETAESACRERFRTKSLKSDGDMMRSWSDEVREDDAFMLANQVKGITKHVAR